MDDTSATAPATPYVMISYARKDPGVAYEIERRLEGMGVRVWMDKSIPHGEEWLAQIWTAINGAAAMIVVWNEAATDSDWVSREVEYALAARSRGGGPTILPFSCGKAKLSAALSPFQTNTTGNCDVAAFLHSWEGKPVSRTLKPFDPERPLEEQGGKILEGSDLVQWSFCCSVHCRLTLFASSLGVASASLRKRKPRRLAILVEAARGAGEMGNIEKVRSAWQGKFPGEDFFLLNLMGPQRDGQFQLNDEGPNGQWLDIVETLRAGVIHLLGTGDATLQFFFKGPVALGLAIGWRLERYWHIDVFHYRGASDEYRHVLSSRELSRFQ